MLSRKKQKMIDFNCVEWNQTLVILVGIFLMIFGHYTFMKMNIEDLENKIDILSEKIKHLSK